MPARNRENESATYMADAEGPVRGGMVQGGGLVGGRPGRQRCGAVGEVAGDTRDLSELALSMDGLKG